MIKKDLLKRIIEISHKSKEGHIASSLSVLDIIYTMYDKIIVDKEKSDFILSKGHASLALYVVLDKFGLLEENIENFCSFNSKLGGHPTIQIKNITASTGSLGHGLPIGVGMALANKIKKTPNNVYVIIGDGESNEGTTWESALLASNHNLNNLYCILDYNHSNDRSLKIDSVLNKFQSFNWYCVEIDGHDENQILEALKTKSDKPIFILANTIKGKGCKRMENNPEWHHKYPNDLEFTEIIKEVEEL